MTDSPEPRPHLADLLRGLAIILPTLALALAWWVPVARRITTGSDHVIDTIDGATLPGLMFDPGEDGNTTAIRVIAIVAVVLGVLWAAAFQRSLSRSSAGMCSIALTMACLLPLAVLALLAAMSGVREAVPRNQFSDVVETTSGWLVVALVPFLFSLGLRKMIAWKPDEPATPIDHYAG